MLFLVELGVFGLEGSGLGRQCIHEPQRQRLGDVRIGHLNELLELLGLYLAAAAAILACGPGLFSIDELIARRFDAAPEVTPSTESEASAPMPEAVASR